MLQYFWSEFSEMFKKLNLFLGNFRKAQGIFRKYISNYFDNLKKFCFNRCRGVKYMLSVNAYSWSLMAVFPSAPNQGFEATCPPPCPLPTRYAPATPLPAEGTPHSLFCQINIEIYGEELGKDYLTIVWKHGRAMCRHGGTCPSPEFWKLM